MPADRDLVASTLARLRGAGRRTGATDFGRWWAGELASLVPHATRSAMQRRRMRPVVAFADDGATVWQPFARGGEIGMDRVARVPAGDEAAGRAAIEGVADAAGSNGVVVALAPQHVLRRVLTLPAAIEENLRQAVAYDLDRHTPFRPDDLYFDAAVLDRDSQRGTLRAELVTARRAIVDRAVQSVEAWGGRVLAVVPDAPEAAAAAKLDLLPEERRLARRGPRWSFWIPLVVLAATAAVAVALPIWQKREQAIALHRLVDEARAQAAISERLRGELDRAVATYNFALERKFSFPPVLQVLDEVTKLLPDDTWLTQLELKSATRGKETQRELMLRGESHNAGRLITLFEESKVFTQAAPRSPTTKIQPGPGEIFDLVAQVRPVPLPAAVALADLPPIAAQPTSPAPPTPSPAVGAPATPPSATVAGPAPSAAAKPPTAAAPPQAGTPPAPSPGPAPAPAPAPAAAPALATPPAGAAAAPKPAPPAATPAPAAPAPAPTAEPGKPRP